ncbi:hypothetical protein BpHYR1_013155 [Brachionus plicatilis]|uniref:Uncharacterized protein n=1 Tax=Brachionus plicatilis TaxID=10195 RepID=A0A3M7RQT1_BRAPC|nr:hypothetical protein BpHYR1_013155 [Brachionus plicatilis]
MTQNYNRIAFTRSSNFWLLNQKIIGNNCHKFQSKLTVCKSANKINSEIEKNQYQINKTVLFYVPISNYYLIEEYINFSFEKRAALSNGLRKISKAIYSNKFN